MLFVYKDFIVREIVQRVNEQLPQVKERKIMACLEKDYDAFMEGDLSTWTHILM